MQKVVLNIALVISMFALNVDANEQGSEIPENNIFARVGDLTITANEFEEIFKSAVRQKYYHGQIPEDEQVSFRQKVAEDIVTQIIVHSDAQKKGLKPDHEIITQGINDYKKKYASNPESINQLEKIIPQLRKRLERQNLIEKMEAKIRNIAQPRADQTANYYQQNPEKFTEPERVWGSVILLNVFPSAGEEMWEEATNLAGQLKFRARNGENFDALAKQFSGHPSAVNGGDLGYLHQGMLDEDVQKTVEALAINEISDPIRVLEGIILFRLNGVQAEKLKPFDEVKQRTAGLLYKELQDRAWDTYVSELKASTYFYLNKNLYVQK